jgi:hypothetical protein
MRPALYKCSNHLKCTLGYHGDDIEVADGMAQVCPECNSPLTPVRRGRSALVPLLINTLVIGCIGVGVWLAWPRLVQMWNKFTAPPVKVEK